MKRDQSDIVNNQGSLSVSDESIARLLCDDNHVEEAVRLIMKKYGEPLYWHIRRMVVAHDDAEDALQETMINVYNQLCKTYPRCYSASN